MTVFEGGMEKKEVMEHAEELLNKYLDGTDFSCIIVHDAEKFEDPNE